MDTESNPINKATLSEELINTHFKPKTNEQLNIENPNRQNRRQATEEQLNNPLHGVKLAQILERLVDHYGWKYLAERVNIRCFKHDPTMKSSLGFLRKTRWARKHVEDVYLDMLEEQQQ
ncbi:VF530 family protein [Tenacibaculum bernardetii]|uniref:VF530 family protein n=1 Tax=Tenacibaculum bernardetii TaxID=3021375 RepID=UPI0030B7F748